MQKLLTPNAQQLFKLLVWFTDLIFLIWFTDDKIFDEMTSL